MTPSKGWSGLILPLVALVAIGAVMIPSGDAAERDGLWAVYESALKGAKYVDLTHTITPDISVWAGFAASSFAPATAGSDIEGFAKKGDIYTYATHGFEATEYTLRTDQLSTQLDPPAHWAPEYPAIDELPASYAIRPLVVISMVEQFEDQPQLPSAGRRHRSLGKDAWAHPGRLRRVCAVRLVEGLARSQTRHLEGVPGRRTRGTENPAQRAQNPVSRT